MIRFSLRLRGKSQKRCRVLRYKQIRTLRLFLQARVSFSHPHHWGCRCIVVRHAHKMAFHSFYLFMVEVAQHSAQGCGVKELTG